MIVMVGNSFYMRQIGQVFLSNNKSAIHWNPKVVPFKEMLDAKKPKIIIYEEKYESIIPSDYPNKIKLSDLYFYEKLDFEDSYDLKKNSLIYIITDKDTQINMVEYLSLNTIKHVKIVTYNTDIQPKTPLYCGKISKLELWQMLKGYEYVSSTENSLYGQWKNVKGCGKFIDCNKLKDLGQFESIHTGFMSYENYLGSYNMLRSI